MRDLEIQQQTAAYCQQHDDKPCAACFSNHRLKGDVALVIGWHLSFLLRADSGQKVASRPP
jgi:hypothetical protein